MKQILPSIYFPGFFSPVRLVTQTIIRLTINNLLPTKMCYFTWLRCILCLTKILFYNNTYLKEMTFSAQQDSSESGCHSLLITLITSFIWLMVLNNISLSYDYKKQKLFLKPFLSLPYFAVVFHPTCLHMYLKANYIFCYSNTTGRLKDLNVCIFGVTYRRMPHGAHIAVFNHFWFSTYLLFITLKLIPIRAVMF